MFDSQRNTRTIQISTTLLAVAFLVGVGIYGYNSRNPFQGQDKSETMALSDQEKGKVAKKVETQLLTKEALVDQRVLKGMLVKGDTARATSTMTAKLKSFKVDVGQFVKQGEVIAVVETSPSEATKQAAEQRYNSLLTDIANVKDALEKLDPEDTVQYINYNNKLLGLERARDAAKQTLMEMQDGWEEYNLRSTVTGHVISLAELSDTNLVKGQVLFTVVPYFVRFEATQAFITEVNAKDSWKGVASGAAMADQPLELSTLQLDKEEEHRALIALVHSTQEGTPITLTFTKQGEEAFWIPKAALIQQNDSSFVRLFAPEQPATLIPVRVHSTVGEKYRIEGEELTGKTIQINP